MKALLDGGRSNDGASWPFPDVRVLVGLAMLVASPGCSGNGSVPAPSADAGLQEGDFIAGYCDAWAPCCAKHGWRSDGVRCRAAFDSPSPYDAAAGAACLAELRARASSPSFCDEAGSVGETSPCSMVFRSRGGAVSPGGACTNVSDCAPSVEGDVRCARTAPVDAPSFCQVVSVGGKAGDAPCIGTVDGAMTSFDNVPSSTGPSPRVFLCDLAAGFACRPSTGACTLPPAIGEACWPEDSACAREARCDAVTARCVARKSTGEPCVVYGDECALGDTCDPSNRTCVPRAANGAVCTSNQGCASDTCLSGTCAPIAALQLALLCGGG